MDEAKNSNCIICGKGLWGRKRTFCSRKCTNVAHQSYPQQRARGLQRKLKFVKEKGGKCTRCGYARNVAALAFHHLESDKKEFALDVRSLSNRKEVYILAELEKCILVCHNCHAEIHNPHLHFSFGIS